MFFQPGMMDFYARIIPESANPATLTPSNGSAIRSHQLRRPSMNKLAPCIAEAIGTFALIFIGVGAISFAHGDLLAIALAHGLTIAVMASATMHISGGHLNPAVTFGALVSGKIDMNKAVRYWAAQLIGAAAAGFVCLMIFNREIVAEGTPALAPDVNAMKGIVIEAILTFFLVFVVFGTGIDAKGPKIGGLAIGLAVTMDILFGGPLTGAAMNPARTFGPALAASSWSAHYVYWLGPLIGGALAGLVYKTFFLDKS
jgi:MIP family channel proteins